jgi:hypothetical protein
LTRRQKKTYIVINEDKKRDIHMTEKPTKRKRGRPFLDKTERLSTKITPQTFAALEREAKRARRSKSHIAEQILQEAFKAPDESMAARAWGAPHVKGTAVLLAKLLTSIEAQTKKRWRDDRFTFDAARHGIVTLLAQMVPEGSVEVPTDVKKRGEAMGEEFSEQWNKPESIGAACALGLWDQLLNANAPNIDHPANERYADGFYQYPKIRESLELDGGDNE